MKAMIFAAGLGTRLKPLTDSVPKALVKVDGQPLLWHNVQRLKSFGVDDLVINIHHFADQIVDYVRSVDDFGINVRFSDERELLLDTGGGILHARGLLQDEDPGSRFLVHNVDVLSNVDIRSMYCESVEKDAMAVLCVSRRPSSRQLIFDDRMRLCGWVNLSTGQVRGPAASSGFRLPYPGWTVSEGDAASEFSDGRFRLFAFSGIHILSQSVFRAFDAFPQFNQVFGIVDFYLAVCRQYPIFGYFQEGFRMLDVGKTDTLQAAGQFLDSVYSF